MGSHNFSKRIDYQMEDRDGFDSEDTKLVAALAELGIQVQSTTNLMRGGVDYTVGMTLLADFLPIIHHKVMKLAIVYALSRPTTDHRILRALIDEFRAEPPQGAPPSYRWTVGAAIEATRDLTYLDELVEIANDHHWKDARWMIIEALGRSRSQEVINLLVELLNDADEGTVGAALSALKRARATVALPRVIEVEQRITDKWVKKLASQTRAALERQKEKEEARRQGVKS
jgi:hypothetical protein